MIEDLDVNANSFNLSADSVPIPQLKDLTVLETFEKSSTAAKLSGAYNSTVGFLKCRFAEITDNQQMKDQGSDQELLGKAHRLVGSIRGVREGAIRKVDKTRTETEKLLRKYSIRLIDVASDFLDEIQRVLK